MNTKFCLIALTLIVSASSAFAGQRHQNDSIALLCKTAPQPYGGGTSVTVTSTDGYDGVLKGAVSGGEAMFITAFGPVNVKISHEPGVTVYSNSEENIELRVVDTTIGGDLPTSATLQRGTGGSILMSCNHE